MASADALDTLIDALEAEQARRQRARFGGHDNPREWLVNTLRQIAERLATAHRLPLDLSDMSPMEQLAVATFLPEAMRPIDLGTVDEIWEAHFRPRSYCQS
jgi:hypothetical protein